MRIKRYFPPPGFRLPRPAEYVVVIERDDCTLFGGFCDKDRNPVDSDDLDEETITALMEGCGYSRSKPWHG